MYYISIPKNLHKLMFQLKSGIYIHNIFKPKAKQSELDYNTGTIISERDNAQKNSLQFLIL